MNQADITTGEMKEQKPTKLIGSAAVMERLGISYTTLWRWIRDEKIPQPNKIGGSNRWRESDIDRLIAG